MILRPGTYKMRAARKGVWLAVLIRVENSHDDDGRVADRPRLVLYVGAERHERPRYEEWGHRLHPIGQAEFDRIGAAHSPETVSPTFDLASAPSLF
jgi:hypothetical protein